LNFNRGGKIIARNDQKMNEEDDKNKNVKVLVEQVNTIRFENSHLRKEGAEDLTSEEKKEHPLLLFISFQLNSLICTILLRNYLMMIKRSKISLAFLREGFENRLKAAMKKFPLLNRLADDFSDLPTFIDGALSSDKMHSKEFVECLICMKSLQLRGGDFQRLNFRDPKQPRSSSAGPESKFLAQIAIVNGVGH